MLRATVTLSGGTHVHVVLSPRGTDEDHEEEGEETGVEGAGEHNEETGGEAHEVEEGPSPIVPELKELAWTSGAFVVFAVLMRYVLYPRLRKGMDARYNSIRSGISGADAARAAARAEVAEYERQLASVRAEAAARVDAARQELESERKAQLAAANARLAQERATAAEQDEADRAAVRDQIQSAVADVVSRAVELGTGVRPSQADVERAVTESMSVGAGR